MKLSGRQIDSFLDDPGNTVAAVLIYGPDQGLVRERADRIMRAVAGSTDDPFRTATVNEQDVARSAPMVVTAWRRRSSAPSRPKAMGW